MSGPPGVGIMVCEGCGQVTPWTPWGRCSQECFDLPRTTVAEQAAAAEAAPAAVAWFMSHGPGEELGEELDEGPT
ncbi:hypothetical protein [Streptacidiphilus rugosus]|uniref:hypothetical protein n=1 Tax=Streptacidiphilus rugosus TaxID=405783 RepID=UPI000569096C|nr:hypothetical protein [Streptacidiphilus rugosus]